MKISRIVFHLFLIWPLFTYCQDSSWTQINLNGDVIVSLPGSIDSVKNLKSGPYIFNFYSGKRLSSLYVVQCSSEKQNLNIYDSVTYQEALSGVQQGTLNYFRERHEQPVIGDTIIGGIPMKTIFNQSLIFQARTRYSGYIFILNDRAYILYAAQVNSMESDSSGLHQFLSSIHFTSNKQEQMFATKKLAFAYNLGRMIGGLGFLVVIGLVVFFVVRAIIS